MAKMFDVIVIHEERSVFRLLHLGGVNIKEPAERRATALLV